MAPVYLGVNARLVEPPGAAHGQDDVLGQVDDGEAVGVQRDGPGGARLVALTDGDEGDDHAPLVKGDVLQARLADERPAHLARGVGADGGGPLARVVVRLVADDLAVGVGGERHAEVL